MKKVSNWLKTMAFIMVLLSFASCKKEQITLSQYELWFPEAANVQDIQVTANCDWTISIDDNADWYVINNTTDASVMSGSGNATIAVVVEPLDNVLERTSSFTITSAKGKIQVK
jgi:hypothetical protein